MVTGIPTHYHRFDDMTARLYKSDLIIVARRPTMDKTAFALRTAVATALFPLKISMEQLMTRILSI